MKYMLDTNICIYLIKQKPTSVIEKFKQIDVGQICMSTVTLAELQYGVEKSVQKDHNRLALTSFLAPLEVLSFCDNAAIEYGKIRAVLESKGTVIGAYDMMIAAHAIANNLSLITNNLKEFQRVPDLNIENWVS